MNGKNKCKLLKEIRQRIADENEIPYVTTECKFRGNCTGTCPKCEAEVRYLEQELEKRRSAGKKIAVAGIAAAMVVTAAGCDLFERQLKGKETIPPEERTTAEQGETTEEPIAGIDLTESPEPTGSVCATFLVGEVPYEETTQVPESTVELILEGDVAWPVQ